ncbi:hypothetical protein [Thermicanus aegyptius]|uniref:hypothetical protein n=1 Tax=Thermicanus aegyptius TaxID=94009 RepID=UPI000418948D|nr:hypothetical protein [Thermicanus aegyptius]
MYLVAILDGYSHHVVSGKCVGDWPPSPKGASSLEWVAKPKGYPSIRVIGG